MKKYLIFLFALLFSVTPQLHAINYVSADGVSEYLRVIDDNTPFYQKVGDETPLFYLPYTYYVKVLGETNDYFHVEINGSHNQPALDGFVPAHLLYDDGLLVTNAYLSLKIVTASTTVLYSESTLSTCLQYVFPDRELTYYGKITTDYGNIYFVGYNNRLGYVKEENVLPFSIPNHPNPLTFIPPESPPEQTPSDNANQDYLGIRVTIIICLIFAGVLGLIITREKKKETKIAPHEYYDENEYS